MFRLIDKELNKSKSKLLNSLKDVQEQYETLLDFSEDSYQKIKSSYNEIKAARIAFIDKTIWRITKIQMISVDLRTVICHINIMASIVSMSQTSYHIAKILNQFQKKEKIKKLLDQIDLQLFLNNFAYIVDNFGEYTKDVIDKISKNNNQNIQRMNSIVKKLVNDKTKDTKLDLNQTFITSKVVHWLKILSSSFTKFINWFYYINYSEMYSETFQDEND